MGKTLDNNKYLKLFIEKSGTLVGGISGTVAATLVPGFGGMLFGGLTAVGIEHLYKEVGYGLKKRLLNEREEIKISAAYTTAVLRIRERLENGEILRDDNFFDEQVGHRDAANEILEGVLLASQQEHEELKIQFYGLLIANISFDRNVNRYYANLLLKIGRSLSYRQLCLLEIISGPYRYKFETAYLAGRGTSETNVGDKVVNKQIELKTGLTLLYSAVKHDVHEEIKNLVQRGIIEEIQAVSKVFIKMKLTTMGVDIVRLMELDRIRPDHIEEIAAGLRWESKYR